MTNEEARDYLKKMLGCAKKSLGDGLCHETCDGCKFDYETDDWEEVMATSIEALEKQSEIVHCKDCENWKIITIETIYGRTAKAGQCELTKWLCGEQGYCMYGRMKGDNDE